MDIAPVGPSNLDPFTPTPPAPEAAEPPAEEVRESAPLPEGSGTRVDTSA